MRSLGWNLIQQDWCPYKKRKLGDRYTQREECAKTWEKSELRRPQGKPILPIP
jgi:hypothetical protein